ncbi:MAG: tetratricopeptide repeat protein [Planctomycetota bacterium]|jgi:hypothetical protein
MKRFQLHAYCSLVGGVALLASSFACGPPESTDTAYTDQTPMPVVARAVEPGTRIALGSGRETAPADVFYPVPLEVSACLDLIGAGKLQQAAPVCEKARELDPGNAEVRAALGKTKIQ